MITNNVPKKWTKEEINLCLQMKEKGISGKEIAIALDRDFLQVSIKLKRLSKMQMVYNTAHLDEKESSNKRFCELINPNSVLDVYAGLDSWYKKNNYPVVSNDKNILSNSDFKMDSLDFVYTMYLQNRRFDIVDLDPFGSAYDCFDTAIKLAKKGLIITFGEMGHIRFKRLDFVRRYYQIKKLEDFKIENMINHVIMIGERNKKKLAPVIVKNWNNISRAYFTIGEIKITEQWENKKVIPTNERSLFD